LISLLVLFLLSSKLYDDVVIGAVTVVDIVPEDDDDDDDDDDDVDVDVDVDVSFSFFFRLSTNSESLPRYFSTGAKISTPDLNPTYIDVIETKVIPLYAHTPAMPYFCANFFAENAIFKQRKQHRLTQSIKSNF